MQDHEIKKINYSDLIKNWEFNLSDKAKSKHCQLISKVRNNLKY